MLLPYEVASAFTRLVTAGRLALNEVAAAWAAAMSIPIRLQPLTDGPMVVELARRLSRASAYAAAYLVLAQQLGADLWTLDGPFYRNASSLGLPARLIS